MPFIIDDDAYNLLKEYLDTIRFAFKTSDDAEEISLDIESRIAELLYENDPEGTHIVTLSEVSKVIERIGKPDEIIDIDERFEGTSVNTSSEEIKIEENVTPPPINPQYSRNPFVRKKIFRDTQNGMLGGVCAGLANYLNIDPTIVRLIAILLLFLSGTTVGIIYIILWIVVPDANTPYLRMQMMGTDPTVENIGKTVTENYQGNELPETPQKKGFLSTVFSIFTKCLIVLGCLIGFPILFALLIVLVVCILVVFAVVPVALVGGLFGENVEFSTPESGTLALYFILSALGAIITVGIPLYLIIKMAFKKKASNISENNRRSLLIIWLIGIALTAVFTVKSVRKAKQVNFEHFNDKIEQLEEIAITSNDSITSSVITDSIK